MLLYRRNEKVLLFIISRFLLFSFIQYIHVCILRIDPVEFPAGMEPEIHGTKELKHPQTDPHKIHTVALMLLYIALNWTNEYVVHFSLRYSIFASGVWPIWLSHFHLNSLGRIIYQLSTASFWNWLPPQQRRLTAHYKFNKISLMLTSSFIVRVKQ